MSEGNMQERIQSCISPLLKWFIQNRRMFPWRQDKDPYHVWVSEIMLQQTRIEAAKEYYIRFMKELPDVQSLCDASQEKLLKLWEGLGYYSRAKNLHKAAKAIVEQYSGHFPDHYRDLLKLSGIGEYTAGAIASICFGEKVPAVDGNVLRVLSRILGSDKNVLLPEVKKEMTALLCAVMPEEAGDFNEALMELGETVCLPNGAPDCDHCPLQKFCIAYEKDLTKELPVRIKKQTRTTEYMTVLLIVSSQGHIALEKRTEKGLLSGMYQLPNLSGRAGIDSIAVILEQWHLKVLSIEELGEAKHIFTHKEWRMKGVRVVTENESECFLWASKEDLHEKYPLPTAFRHFNLV